MKRYFLAGFLLLLLLTGCSSERMINVISREDGSGTRGAFTELVGISYEDGGKTVDLTSDNAEITNSTAVVMQTVSEDKNAIGYMSMGSLNDSVKALKVDGVAPTTDNVKNGDYSIARSFLIATKGEKAPATEDFINFILSDSGQKIVSENGYVASESGKAYSPTGTAGKVRVAGSSSVTPVMDALAEEYKKLNPDAEIEIEQSDSTTGITAVTEGIADIGMSSRELKEDELNKGLTPVTIAYDGLAVVVNKDNKIENLSREQIHDIFSGELTDWESVKGGENEE